MSAPAFVVTIRQQPPFGGSPIYAARDAAGHAVAAFKRLTLGQAVTFVERAGTTVRLEGGPR